MTEEDPTVPTTSGLVAQNSMRDRDMTAANSAFAVVTADPAVAGFVAVPCDSNGIRVQSSGLVAHNSVCESDKNASNSGFAVVAADPADPGFIAVPGFIGVPCDSNGIPVQSYEERCVLLSV